MQPWGNRAAAPVKQQNYWGRAVRHNAAAWKITIDTGLFWENSNDVSGAFWTNGPTFKITPTTDFFFTGESREEILDALIYAITESEGIVKDTREVGSGKTMLRRMLLERLPQQVEAIYLGNPSLSREEMLSAIADGLDLDSGGRHCPKQQSNLT